jgi:hypothetical protein
MQKMQAMGKMGDQAGSMGPYVKIPAKYAAKETSGLKVTLKKGKNENNFKLED